RMRLIIETLALGSEVFFLELAQETFGRVYHHPRLNRLHKAQHQDKISWLLAISRQRIRKHLSHLLEEDDTARRNWIILDLAMTCAIGIVSDRLVLAGLDSINKYEFRE